MKKYSISIKKFPNRDLRPTNWQCFGVYIDDSYYCWAEALIFSAGSEFGINGGRISKLFVYHRSPAGHCGYMEIGYARGIWNKRPDNAKARAVLAYFIENPPPFVDFPEAH